MGHASSIAAGIALQKPDRNVYVVDGDGGSIMHLGALAVNGGLGAVHAVDGSAPSALQSEHVVVNNGAHDSVGGQPTAAFDVSLSAVAKGCGYKMVREEPALTSAEALAALTDMRTTAGPAFLEILVKKGNRKDLGRPTTTALQNKIAFEGFVQGKL